jgi:hypothetical protein
MSPEQERFMAFEGLVQWAHAVVLQAARLSEAQKLSMITATWSGPLGADG